MSMEQAWVKFYSVTDLSSPHNLVKAEKVIKDFDDNLIYENINKIIEFYNIKLFFQNDMYLTIWSKEKRKIYLYTVNKFSKHIGKYFSNVKESNIKDILNEVNIEYLENFWKLFDYYKIYLNISGAFFARLLSHERLKLYDILSCRGIVRYYDIEISQYLLNYERSAEILADKYISSKDISRKMYHFPKTLSLDDKEGIIVRYIECGRANPNYLKLIFEFQNSSDLYISDRTKLKAKRKYEEERKKDLKDGYSFQYNVEVRFLDNQEIEKKIEMVDRNLCASYSSQWIKENRDYPTILNNFIYLFEFTDLQFRFQHVHKVNTMGIFERVMGVKSKKEYIKGTAFQQIQSLAMLQTMGYYNELKKNDIRFEEVLEWFFYEYVKSEFGIEGFYLNLPSENSTYLEKCRTIASEIDSILKQFKLFVEDREINHELLQLSSEHMCVKDIPSLLKKKYIYPIGDEYKIASNYLFSDQSHLNYIQGIDSHYRAFYILIEKEKVQKKDFEEYQFHAVNWLIEKGYLYEDRKNILKNSKKKIWLLKELYYNDVISNYHVKEFSKSINELEAKKILECTSSFLSRPEQNYFNYLLNKSEFSNGLDLRNKYIHGTQPRDTWIHEQDYYIFLRILILIIIKINEEFCLAEDEGILK